MSGKNKYKRKMFSYKKRHSGYYLQPGFVGFLCTCSNKLKERECVRESINLLEEFADKLFGKEEPEVWDSEKEVDDIDEQLNKEVDSIQKMRLGDRFQAVDSGTNGIVGIKTTVPDPVNLAYTIMLSLSKIQKSKFLLRLLPVEVTCKAFINDICSACDPLLDKHFIEGKKTFAVVYNHRNNNRLKREEVIENVARLVCQKNETNKTDLKYPDLAILIEVIRNMCCISVVPYFFHLKKYNLMELAPQISVCSSSDQ